MEYPVHQSLSVVGAEDIYRTDEWWKSVVKYQYADSKSDGTTAAVYLWHRRDDGWTRKQKYTINSIDDWREDQQVVEKMIGGEEPPETETDDSSELPVSDYYSTGDHYTVFRSEEWWKGIVQVTQKGEYETEEIMIYVWQRRDGEWRRRQKYTIKSNEDWKEEKTIIHEMLDISDGEEDSSAIENGREGSNTISGNASTESTPVSDELAKINETLEAIEKEEDIINN